MSQPHRPSTAQEIFNTVALHLITQGRPARRGDSCYYRAPNGDKCAVGILIPDEMYSPNMEFQTVGTIKRLLPKELQPHISLLDHLQEVHDSKAHSKQCFNMEFLKKELKQIATRFELSDQILCIA